MKFKKKAFDRYHILSKALIFLVPEARLELARA